MIKELHQDNHATHTTRKCLFLCPVCEFDMVDETTTKWANPVINEIMSNVSIEAHCKYCNMSVTFPDNQSLLEWFVKYSILSEP